VKDPNAIHFSDGGRVRYNTPAAGAKYGELMEPDASRPSPTGTSLFIAVAVIAAMATGVSYDYLFGPDEPREAEISRETLADGRWVTPHLCALPFLEKPPLYYDTVALAFALTGRRTPTVARSVSVLFGLLMAAAAWLFGRRWRGARAAWVILLVLVTMPRFWRYSHDILLDIAMGALCSCALLCFARASFWAPGRTEERASLGLFGLFSAGAFLTKGFLAVFTVGLIVGAFCLVERRGDMLRKLLRPGPLLLFSVPVAAWVFLYYREGGMAYLHEHFVNNIAGRFFHMHFQYPAIRFAHTDIGRAIPWHFYLTTMPEMFGLWVAAIPFALWNGIRRRARSESAEERSILSLILIWSFLPAVVLSFSEAKERTYILPSYTGLALLLGWWLDGLLWEREGESWRGVGWLAIVFPVAAYGFLASRTDYRMFLGCALAAMLPAAARAIYCVFRERFTEGVYLLFAILLCVMSVTHAPNVMCRRYKKRCLIAFSRDLWRRAGNHPVYLYRPDDSVRGSVPFYGDRTTPELDLLDELRSAAKGGSTVFVVVQEWVFEKELTAAPSLDGLLHIVPMRPYDSEPRLLLMVNRTDR
jgi:4-amino-4-deoxy-L-arabinose transferase-like glycosyltransferase